MTETLYWITRLDGLNVFFIVSTVITSFIVIFGIMGRFIHGKQDFGKPFNRIMKYGVPTLLISIMALIFVPTTKDAIMIYGVGSTIDYLKQNETAKELPDKCIEVLDAYIESLNKKDTQK